MSLTACVPTLKAAFLVIWCERNKTNISLKVLVCLFAFSCRWPQILPVCFSLPLPVAYEPLLIGWVEVSLSLFLCLSLSLSRPTSAGFQSKHRSYSLQQDDSLTPRQTHSSHFHYPHLPFLLLPSPPFPTSQTTGCLTTQCLLVHRCTF